MTSERKVAANRANAARSTGPRTDDGKAVACRNALRHGLFASESLLPSEDGEALVAFEGRLRAELAPVGEFEALLVDRIVAAAWRLRRLHRVEVNLFRHHMEEGALTTALAYWDGPVKRDEGYAFRVDAKNGDALSKLSRYESTIERSLLKAVHELQRLQTLRTGGTVPVPLVLDVAIDPPA